MSADSEQGMTFGYGIDPHKKDHSFIELTEGLQKL